MTTKPAVPHTPTPWKAMPCRNGWHVVTEQNRFVANCTDSTGKDDITSEPNAAFIVRAVNAHEELMKVARGVVLNGHTRPGDCHSDDYMGMCVCGYDQAEKAIARAEGGK